MGHDPERGNSVDDGVPYILKLFRVKEGTSYTFRTLSPRYEGLTTHYVDRQSRFCTGAESCQYHKKFDAVWKGYAGVEVWDSHSGLWFPTVLEMTEHVELDFRGIWKRGQHWKISRGVKTKKTSPPTCAGLLGEVDSQLLPRPFDILPVLQTVFHCPHIKLGVPNPMPARIVLQASAGEPPIGTVFKDVPAPSVEERKTFRELLQLDKEHRSKKYKEGEK